MRPARIPIYGLTLARTQLCADERVLCFNARQQSGKLLTAIAEGGIFRLMDMDKFNLHMGPAIERAMKTLLSEKHLYQVVEVDLGFTTELAKEDLDQKPRSPSAVGGGAYSSAPSVEEHSEDIKSLAQCVWSPCIPVGRGPGQPLLIAADAAPGRSATQFKLPTINTFCSRCEDRWPFNPILEGALYVVGSPLTAWYYLRYLCQQCKEHEVYFLLKREGLKLNLSGRDPLEVLPVPAVLPKAHRRHFSDALVAHHAGQTLAGIFLLRVCIEQFWRTRPEVKALTDQDSRTPGEKLGEAYQRTLPKDFRDRFPSLTDVYSDLSMAMHAAEASAETFERARQNIIEHFDARRLFKLRSAPPDRKVVGQ